MNLSVKSKNLSSFIEKPPDFESDIHIAAGEEKNLQAFNILLKVVTRMLRRKMKMALLQEIPVIKYRSG
jgi:hypothetical protein